jgi:hypothetical protein
VTRNKEKNKPIHGLVREYRRTVETSSGLTIKECCRGQCYQLRLFEGKAHGTQQGEAAYRGLSKF